MADEQSEQEPFEWVVPVDPAEMFEVGDCCQ
jgi:hypothetical protein